MAVFMGAIAVEAFAQTIEGTATYREPMALPQGAVFEATLEVVSRADAPATVFATTRRTSPGNPPIAFTIAYDTGKIVERARYVVRARILADGKLLCTDDQATPAITGGHATRVSITMRRAGAGTSTAVASQPALENSFWKAVELAGMPVPALGDKREAHLVFQPDGRVSGWDGCNRISGSYVRKGDRVTFGQLAGTQMACPDTAEIERRFRGALKGTSRWRIAAGRLELYGATGKPLAVFERGQQDPQAPPADASSLQGTRWQLVKFQGGDDRTLTPDEPARYTIDFGADGRLTARIDCNRGSGTWKVTGSNQLELGPLALTRAKWSPDGSLQDQIVKQWTYIRSFVLEDGHLFLSLMGDGGIYELEPRAGRYPEPVLVAGREVR